MTDFFVNSKEEKKFENKFAKFAESKLQREEANRLVNLSVDVKKISDQMRVLAVRRKPVKALLPSVKMACRVLEDMPMLSSVIGRTSADLPQKEPMHKGRSLATKLAKLAAVAAECLDCPEWDDVDALKELEMLDMIRRRSIVDTQEAGEEWNTVYSSNVMPTLDANLCGATRELFSEVSVLGKGIHGFPRRIADDAEDGDEDEDDQPPQDPPTQGGQGPQDPRDDDQDQGPQDPPGSPPGDSDDSPRHGQAPGDGSLGGPLQDALIPAALDIPVEVVEDIPVHVADPEEPLPVLVADPDELPATPLRAESRDRSISPIPLRYPSGSEVPTPSRSTSSSSTSYVTAPSTRSSASGSPTEKPVPSSVRGSRVRMMDEEDLEEREMEMGMGGMRREETPPSRRGRRVSPRVPRDSNGERRESGRMMRKRRREGDDESDSTTDDDLGLMRRDKKKTKKVGHSPLPPTPATTTTTAAPTTSTPTIAQRLMTPLRGLWSRMSSAPQVVRSSESQDGWDIVVIRRQEREEMQRKEREERQRKRDERQESEERRESEEEMEVDGDDEMEVDEEEKEAEEQ